MVWIDNRGNNEQLILSFKELTLKYFEVTLKYFEVTLKYFEFWLWITSKILRKKFRSPKLRVLTLKIRLRKSKSRNSTSKLRLRNTLTPVMQKLITNVCSFRFWETKVTLEYRLFTTEIWCQWLTSRIFSSTMTSFLMSAIQEGLKDTLISYGRLGNLLKKKCSSWYFDQFSQKYTENQENFNFWELLTFILKTDKS